MGELNLTRRAFTKLAAVTGAAVACTAAAPNAHVASEICKGPRRLMGWISSVDGAPWMALRDGPRVYVQWGTAPENSNYDDSCRNLVDKMLSLIHI